MANNNKKLRPWFDSSLVDTRSSYKLVVNMDGSEFTFPYQVKGDKDDLQRHKAKTREMSPPKQAKNVEQVREAFVTKKEDDDEIDMLDERRKKKKEEEEEEEEEGKERS